MTETFRRSLKESRCIFTFRHSRISFVHLPGEEQLFILTRLLAVEAAMRSKTF